MRKKELIRTVSVKCAAAIMTAAVLTSPIAGPLTLTVTVYADEPEFPPAKDGSVRVYSEGEEVTHNAGNVTANAEDIAALSIDARSENSNVTVTAGNVSNSSPSGGGLEVLAGKNSTTNVALSGTELTGTQYSLSATADNGGSNTVGIACNTGKIQVTADNTGSNSVTQKGQVNKTAASSVDENADHSASNTVELYGGADNVNMLADNSGKNTFTTGGNAGVVNTNADNSGSNTASVAGGILNLEANADNKGSNTVNISGDATGMVNTTVQNGGSNTVTVAGNIGIGLNAASKSKSGVNTIIVGGDVGSSDAIAGVIISDCTGENHIVIEGTIKAKSNGIGVAIQENQNNPLPKDTLTVWKIEKNSDDAVAGRPEDNGFIRDEKAEQTIQYIIRVMNPEAGATLSATGANGTALNTTNGVGDKDLNWAYEGDKVLLKIDLQEGYDLVGAYGDEGQTTELLKDEQGNYYIQVPKGGGVILSVKVSPTPSHESIPEQDQTHAVIPEPEPYVPQVNAGGADNNKTDQAEMSEPFQSQGSGIILILSDDMIKNYASLDLLTDIIDLQNTAEKEIFLTAYAKTMKAFNGKDIGLDEARKQAKITALAEVFALRCGYTDKEHDEYTARFISAYNKLFVNKSFSTDYYFASDIVKYIAEEAEKSEPEPEPKPKPLKPYNSTPEPIPTPSPDEPVPADSAVQQAVADGTAQLAVSDSTVQLAADGAVQQAVADGAVQSAVADGAVQQTAADSTVQSAVADGSTV